MSASQTLFCIIFFTNHIMYLEGLSISVSREQSLFVFKSCRQLQVWPNHNLRFYEFNRCYRWTFWLFLAVCDVQQWCNDYPCRDFTSQEQKPICRINSELWNWWFTGQRCSLCLNFWIHECWMWWIRGKPRREPKQLSRGCGCHGWWLRDPQPESPSAPPRRAPLRGSHRGPAPARPGPGAPSCRTRHVRFHVSLPAGAQMGSAHAPTAGKVGQTPPLTWPAPLSYPRRLPAGAQPGCARQPTWLGWARAAPRAPSAREDLPVLLTPERSAQKSGGQKGAPREVSGSRAGNEWDREASSNRWHLAPGCVHFHAS